MKRVGAKSCAVAAAAVLALLTSAGQGAQPDPQDTDVGSRAPGLERIKGLAGEWVALGEDGRPTDVPSSSIRVTAGGSAVIEVLFPGTEHEMITMYHQEGETLVLTHYCVEGNQPHMHARRGRGPDQIVFECQGRGIDCGLDRHMHQGTITWIDADHIISEWNLVDGGEIDQTGRFDLVRRKPR